MTDRDDVYTGPDGFTDKDRELENYLHTLVLNDSTIIDALARILGLITKLDARAEQHQTFLNAEIRALIATVAAQSSATGPSVPIVAPAADAFSALNPEVSLLQYVSSYIDNRTAVDVGAHVGDVAKRLLDCGCRVYAFEPFPTSFAALQDRLGGRADFSASPVAIGAADGQGQLNIAAATTEDESPDASLFHSLVDHPLGTSIKFTGAVPVQVRSLASLRQTGEIPRQIGLLKVDAEGADIEVIKGIGEPDIPVVMTEYWDSDHAFGTGAHGHLAPTVELMRSIGYVWHVVIYHIDEDETISYYFNHAQTIPGSWGNAIFFKERSLFAHAAQWCEAALRPTLNL
jgi:FkbM family methyltransferase